MKDREHIEQKALVDWFSRQYPKLTMFAIPNGGLRHIRTATKLKREGVLAGVADLFLMKPNKYYSGLFIEMKAPKGRVAPSQLSFMGRCIVNGYKYKVCYGAEEAMNFIKEYLKD